MFIYRWLKSLFSVRGCERCGAPAVGFGCVVAGKLFRTDATGKKVTDFRLGAPVSMCAGCLKGGQWLS